MTQRAENSPNLVDTDDVSLFAGADVRILKKEPGVPFTLAEIGSALEQHKPVMFFVTHGESSTGCLQDLEGMGALCAR